jgi:hypothetical protein
MYSTQEAIKPYQNREKKNSAVQSSPHWQGNNALAPFKSKAKTIQHKL